MRRRWGSSPGFLGNPFGSMPRARDSGDPGATSHIGRPDAAFRLVNSVGIATSRVFGAESSRPASLLCTLRTHQSPSEWQHSLPACLLDCDRAGLTPAGFHQDVSPFHLGSPSSKLVPSAMTMSAVSCTSRAHFSEHSWKSAIRSRCWFAFSNPRLRREGDSPLFSTASRVKLIRGLSRSTKATDRIRPRLRQPNPFSLAVVLERAM